jgi:cardiolipin synthase
MLLVIVVTALGTLLLAVVAMNFVTPEKKIQRKVEHRFPSTTRSSRARCR